MHRNFQGICHGQWNSHSGSPPVWVVSEWMFTDRAKSHAGVAEGSFTSCYRDSLMLRCHPSLQQGAIPSISHSHSTLAVAVLAPHSYITSEMHSEMCKLVWWQHIQCHVEDTDRVQNFVAALTCHYALFLTTWKLEWSQAGFIRTTLYTQASYFFHLS